MAVQLPIELKVTGFQDAGSEMQRIADLAKRIADQAQKPIKVPDVSMPKSTAAASITTVDWARPETFGGLASAVATRGEESRQTALASGASAKDADRAAKTTIAALTEDIRKAIRTAVDPKGTNGPVARNKYEIGVESLNTALEAATQAMQGFANQVRTASGPEITLSKESRSTLRSQGESLAAAGRLSNETAGLRTAQGGVSLSRTDVLYQPSPVAQRLHQQARQTEERTARVRLDTAKEEEKQALARQQQVRQASASAPVNPPPPGGRDFVDSTRKSPAKRVAPAGRAKNGVGEWIRYMAEYAARYEDPTMVPEAEYEAMMDAITGATRGLKTPEARQEFIQQQPSYVRGMGFRLENLALGSKGAQTAFRYKKDDLDRITGPKARAELQRIYKELTNKTASGAWGTDSLRAEIRAARGTDPELIGTTQPAKDILKALEGGQWPEQVVRELSRLQIDDLPLLPGGLPPQYKATPIGQSMGRGAQRIIQTTAPRRSQVVPRRRVPGTAAMGRPRKITPAKPAEVVYKEIFDDALEGALAAAEQERTSSPKVEREVQRAAEEIAESVVKQSRPADELDEITNINQLRALAKTEGVRIPKPGTKGVTRDFIRDKIRAARGVAQAAVEQAPAAPIAAIEGLADLNINQLRKLAQKQGVNVPKIGTKGITKQWLIDRIEKKLSAAPTANEATQQRADEVAAAEVQADAIAEVVAQEVAPKGKKGVTRVNAPAYLTQVAEEVVDDRPVAGPGVPKPPLPDRLVQQLNRSAVRRGQGRFRIGYDRYGRPLPPPTYEELPPGYTTSYRRLADKAPVVPFVNTEALPNAFLESFALARQGGDSPERDAALSELRRRGRILEETLKRDAQGELVRDASGKPIRQQGFIDFTAAEGPAGPYGQLPGVARQYDGAPYSWRRAFENLDAGPVTGAPPEAYARRVDPKVREELKRARRQWLDRMRKMVQFREEQGLTGTPFPSRWSTDAQGRPISGFEAFPVAGPGAVERFDTLGQAIGRSEFYNEKLGSVPVFNRVAEVRNRRAARTNLEKWLQERLGYTFKKPTESAVQTMDSLGYFSDSDEWLRASREGGTGNPYFMEASGGRLRLRGGLDGISDMASFNPMQWKGMSEENLLTPEQILKLSREVGRGKNPDELAEKYNIPESAVSRYAQVQKRLDELNLPYAAADQDTVGAYLAEDRRIRRGPRARFPGGSSRGYNFSQMRGGRRPYGRWVDEAGNTLYTRGRRVRTEKTAKRIDPNATFESAEASSGLQRLREVVGGDAPLQVAQSLIAQRALDDAVDQRRIELEAAAANAPDEQFISKALREERDALRAQVGSGLEYFGPRGTERGEAGRARAQSMLAAVEREIQREIPARRAGWVRNELAAFSEFPGIGRTGQLRSGQAFAVEPMAIPDEQGNRFRTRSVDPETLKLQYFQSEMEAYDYLARRDLASRRRLRSPQGMKWKEAEQLGYQVLQEAGGFQVYDPNATARDKPFVTAKQARDRARELAANDLNNEAVITRSAELQANALEAIAADAARGPRRSMNKREVTSRFVDSFKARWSKLFEGAPDPESTDPKEMKRYAQQELVRQRLADTRRGYSSPSLGEIELTPFEGVMSALADLYEVNPTAIPRNRLEGITPASIARMKADAERYNRIRRRGARATLRGRLDLFPAASVEENKTRDGNSYVSDADAQIYDATMRPSAADLAQLGSFVDDTDVGITQRAEAMRRAQRRQAIMRAEVEKAGMTYSPNLRYEMVAGKPEVRLTSLQKMAERLGKDPALVAPFLEIKDRQLFDANRLELASGQLNEEQLLAAAIQRTAEYDTPDQRQIAGIDLDREKFQAQLDAQFAGTPAEKAKRLLQGLPVMRSGTANEQLSNVQRATTRARAIAATTEERLYQRMVMAGLGRDAGLTLPPNDIEDVRKALESEVFQATSKFGPEGKEALPWGELGDAVLPTPETFGGYLAKKGVTEEALRESIEKGTPLMLTEKVRDRSGKRDRMKTVQRPLTLAEQLGLVGVGEYRLGSMAENFRRRNPREVPNVVTPVTPVSQLEAARALAALYPGGGYSSRQPGFGEGFFQLRDPRRQTDAYAEGLQNARLQKGDGEALRLLQGDLRVTGQELAREFGGRPVGPVPGMVRARLRELLPGNFAAQRQAYAAFAEGLPGVGSGRIGPGLGVRGGQLSLGLGGRTRAAMQEGVVQEVVKELGRTAPGLVAGGSTPPTQTAGAGGGGTKPPKPPTPSGALPDDFDLPDDVQFTPGKDAWGNDQLGLTPRAKAKVKALAEAAAGSGMSWEDYEKQMRAALAARSGQDPLAGKAIQTILKEARFSYDKGAAGGGPGTPPPGSSSSGSKPSGPYGYYGYSDLAPGGGPRLGAKPSAVGDGLSATFEGWTAAWQKEGASEDRAAEALRQMRLRETRANAQGVTRRGASARGILGRKVTFTNEFGEQVEGYSRSQEYLRSPEGRTGPEAADAALTKQEEKNKLRREILKQDDRVLAAMREELLLASEGAAMRSAISAGDPAIISNKVDAELNKMIERNRVQGGMQGREGFDVEALRRRALNYSSRLASEGRGSEAAQVRALAESGDFQGFLDMQRRLRQDRRMGNLPGDTEFNDELARRRRVLRSQRRVDSQGRITAAGRLEMEEEADATVRNERYKMEMMEEENRRRVAMGLPKKRAGRGGGFHGVGKAFSEIGEQLAPGELIRNSIGMMTWALPMSMTFGIIGFLRETLETSLEIEKAFRKTQNQFQLAYGPQAAGYLREFNGQVVSIARSMNIPQVQLNEVGRSIVASFGPTSGVELASGISPGSPTSTGMDLANSQFQGVAEFSYVTGRELERVKDEFQSVGLAWGLDARATGDLLIAAEQAYGVKPDTLSQGVADSSTVAAASGFRAEEWTALISETERRAGSRSAVAVAESLNRALTDIPRKYTDLLALREQLPQLRTEEFSRQLAQGDTAGVLTSISDIAAQIRTEQEQRNDPLWRRGEQDLILTTLGSERNDKDFWAALTSLSTIMDGSNPTFQNMMNAADQDGLATRYANTQSSLRGSIDSMIGSITELTVQLAQAGITELFSEIVNIGASLVGFLSKAVGLFTALDEKLGGTIRTFGQIVLTAKLLDWTFKKMALVGTTSDASTLKQWIGNAGRTLTPGFDPAAPRTPGFVAAQSARMRKGILGDKFDDAMDAIAASGTPTVITGAATKAAKEAAPAAAKEATVAAATARSATGVVDDVVEAGGTTVLPVSGGRRRPRLPGLTSLLSRFGGRFGLGRAAAPAVANAAAPAMSAAEAAEMGMLSQTGLAPSGVARAGASLPTGWIGGTGASGASTAAAGGSRLAAAGGPVALALSAALIGGMKLQDFRDSQKAEADRIFTDLREKSPELLAVTENRESGLGTGLREGLGGRERFNQIRTRARLANIYESQVEEFRQGMANFPGDDAREVIMQSFALGGSQSDVAANLFMGETPEAKAWWKQAWNIVSPWDAGLKGAEDVTQKKDADGNYVLGAARDRVVAMRGRIVDRIKKEDSSLNGDQVADQANRAVNQLLQGDIEGIMEDVDQGIPGAVAAFDQIKEQARTNPELNRMLQAATNPMKEELVQFDTNTAQPLDLLMANYATGDVTSGDVLSALREGRKQLDDMQAEAERKGGKRAEIAKLQNEYNKAEQDFYTKIQKSNQTTALLQQRAFGGQSEFENLGFAIQQNLDNINDPNLSPEERQAAGDALVQNLQSQFAAYVRGDDYTFSSPQTRLARIQKGLETTSQQREALMLGQARRIAQNASYFTGSFQDPGEDPAVAAEQAYQFLADEMSRNPNSDPAYWNQWMRNVAIMRSENQKRQAEAQRRGIPLLGIPGAPLDPSWNRVISAAGDRAAAGPAIGTEFKTGGVNYKFDGKVFVADVPRDENGIPINGRVEDNLSLADAIEAGFKYNADAAREAAESAARRDLVEAGLGGGYQAPEAGAEVTVRGRTKREATRTYEFDGVNWVAQPKNGESVRVGGTNYRYKDGEWIADGARAKGDPAVLSGSDAAAAWAADSRSRVYTPGEMAEIERRGRLVGESGPGATKPLAYVPRKDSKSAEIEARIQNANTRRQQAIEAGKDTTAYDQEILALEDYMKIQDEEAERQAKADLWRYDLANIAITGSQRRAADSAYAYATGGRNLRTMGVELANLQQNIAEAEQYQAEYGAIDPETGTMRDRNAYEEQVNKETEAKTAVANQQRAMEQYARDLRMAQTVQRRGAEQNLLYATKGRNNQTMMQEVNNLQQDVAVFLQNYNELRASGDDLLAEQAWNQYLEAKADVADKFIELVLYQRNLTKKIMGSDRRGVLIAAYVAINGVSEETLKMQENDIKTRIREAEEEYRFLKSIGREAEAEAALNEAGRLKAELANKARERRNFMRELAASENAIIMAQLNYHGQTVQAAAANLAEQQRIMNDMNANPQDFTEAQRNQQQAQVINAAAQMRQTVYNKSIQDMDFNLMLGRITTGQAIAQLEAMRALYADNEQMSREIEQKIFELKNSADMQYNLPDLLGLPKFYDARRLAQYGGGGDQSYGAIDTSGYDATMSGMPGYAPFSSGSPMPTSSASVPAPTASLTAGSPLSFEQWKSQQEPMAFTRDMVPDGQGGMIDRAAKYWRDQYANYLGNFQAGASTAGVIDNRNMQINIYVNNGSGPAEVVSVVADLLASQRSGNTLVNY